jgi:hypothetical protein
VRYQIVAPQSSKGRRKNGGIRDAHMVWVGGEVERNEEALKLKKGEDMKYLD